MTDHRPQPLCKYLPIVDGDIIQDIPTKMIAQGRFAKYVLTLFSFDWSLIELHCKNSRHGWAHHERRNWIHWLPYSGDQRHTAVFGVDFKSLHLTRRRSACHSPSVPLAEKTWLFRRKRHSTRLSRCTPCPHSRRTTTWRKPSSETPNSPASVGSSPTRLLRMAFLLSTTGESSSCEKDAGYVLLMRALGVDGTLLVRWEAATSSAWTLTVGLRRSHPAGIFPLERIHAYFGPVLPVPRHKVSRRLCVQQDAPLRRYRSSYSSGVSSANAQSQSPQGDTRTA